MARLRAQPARSSSTVDTSGLSRCRSVTHPHVLREEGQVAGYTSPQVHLDLLHGDRLLHVWAIVPLVLVSLSSVRNAHYAIHAMVPWSVWSALGLKELGDRLAAQGWSTARLRRLTAATFTALATACGLGFWLAGPWLDRRGVEWAFYETTGRRLLPGEPLALLYDDWDRDPYPTPFGAIPHDLAVRLYYLERPACWHFNTASLRSQGIGIVFTLYGSEGWDFSGNPRPRARPAGT